MTVGMWMGILLVLAGLTLGLLIGLLLADQAWADLRARLFPGTFVRESRLPGRLAVGLLVAVLAAVGGISIFSQYSATGQNPTPNPPKPTETTQ